MREFDIYLGTFWYQLFNNRVPEYDFDDIFSISEKFSRKHYNEFPLNTRIRWRGPCMLLEDVKKIKKNIINKRRILSLNILFNIKMYCIT